MVRPPSLVSKPNADPIWIIVEQDGKPAQQFELRVEQERALVFGSGPDADYQLEAAPAIVFFVEREGDHVWLTPAYRRDELRVDSQRVEARRCIYHRASIEFGSTRLRLRVRDAPPTLRGESVTCLVEPDSELERLFAMLEAGKAQAAEANSEQHRQDIGLNGSLSSRTTEMSRGELLSLFEYDENTPPVNASAASDAVARSPILLKPVAAPHSLMARLGVLAQQRPLLVALVAAIGVAILVLFLLGAADLLGHYGHGTKKLDPMGWTFPSAPRYHASVAPESNRATPPNR